MAVTCKNVNVFICIQLRHSSFKMYRFHCLLWEVVKNQNMQPENHLVKNIVYSGSKQNVTMTMVNGQILYENGQFLIGFDPKEIYAKANAIIGRMK